MKPSGDVALVAVIPGPPSPGGPQYGCPTELLEGLWVSQSLAGRDGEQTMLSGIHRGVCCRRNSLNDHHTGASRQCPLPLAPPAPSPPRVAAVDQECGAIPGP